MEFNFNCLFVGLYILCVKMKTFLCTEEGALLHNKRNCFPSYPDHYLTARGGGGRDTAYESGGDARRLA